MIDSNNGERCQVNWVKGDKAGVSYIDEPWYPGSMVVDTPKLVEHYEDYTHPIRHALGWKKVKACREQILTSNPSAVVEEQDALFKLLSS